MKTNETVVPKMLRGLTVAIVGAHVTGAVYCSVSMVTMGSIALSTPTHGLILLASVAVVGWSAKRILRAIDQDDATMIDYEEERA